MENTSNYKIVVIGAGAVGSVIGGLLAQAGEDATLIGRKAHVDEINRTGLRISGALGEFTVHLQAKQELDFKPDLVLLSVKTQDVEVVCKQIEKYATGIPIVTLQNGIRSDEIAAGTFGKENIISGVVLFNASFTKSGFVSCEVKGSIIIGEAYKENGNRIHEIADILNRAIKTHIKDNIYGAHWTKLLVNVMGNSLEAMTGMNFGDCMKYAGLRRIGIHILREALAIMEKSQIELESLPDLPLSAFRFIGNSPLGVSSLILKVTMSGTHTITSTLQSIRKGRPTEIEYLNGEIVRQAAKIGMAAPYNSKVVECVHEIEKTGRFLPITYLEKSAFKEKE